MSKIKVGIAGATGVVGQRLITLLAEHPWFEISALAASENSSGKQYKEACSWRLKHPIPESVAEITVEKTEPGLDCSVLFSAASGPAVQAFETAFARAGYAVVSNASAHRMGEDIPLLIPEINADHLDMIGPQQFSRGFNQGFIVTNPNCVAVPLTMALAPLWRAFGIEAVLVASLQALSGAGYPGVASVDMIDNVLPYIKGEEEKIEAEPQKILGTYTQNAFHPAEFTASASCHRVPVKEGHLLTASVKLTNSVSTDEVIDCLQSFKGDITGLHLPSAPEKPLTIRTEPDRPQPALDRDEAGGMSVTVGRIRSCPVFDVKMSILGHNTLRGAAGAAVLNAELLAIKGFLSKEAVG